MIAILVDPSPEGFLLDLYAVRSGYCHYAPSSPCFAAESSRRTHANSLPIGFCSSDAAVLLQRQQANRPGKRHRQHLVHDRRDAASLRHGVSEPCPHQSRTASDHASVCRREQVLANTATTLSDRALRLLCT